MKTHRIALAMVVLLSSFGCTADHELVEVAPNKKARYDVSRSFERAKEVFKERGIEVVVASAHRTVAKQKELIARNCNNSPGSLHCDPKPGRPPACLLKGNDPKSCPHTSGAAIDVLARGVRVLDLCQNYEQEGCLPRAQQQVIHVMLENGFCVYLRELFHFEHIEAVKRMGGSTNVLCATDTSHPLLQNVP